MARTAGSSWVIVAGLAAAAALKPACRGVGGGDDTDTPVTDTLADALAAVGPSVVEPALARARAEADTLAAATADLAAVRAAGEDDTAALAAAQAAWYATMAAWQEAELHQIGPAGASLTAVGGQDLRDEVYSWPTVNPCRVDQETVEASWDDADFFEVNLVNVYGLDALETLLFSPRGENSCPSQVDINADGTWAALGEDGVERNRAAYAAAVAAHLVATIDTLQVAWSADGGDFSGQLAAAGDDGSPYESREQALNAVFDALFYLDTKTKDRKLGGPLGYWDCGSDDCTGDIESPMAGRSNEWIAANLRGYRALFTGGDGAGMDDVLRDLGHDDVADAMLAALDDADKKAAAVTMPVDDALTDDRADAEALYAALRSVTELLKGDVATLLVLQIPEDGAGDND